MSMTRANTGSSHAKTLHPQQHISNLDLEKNKYQSGNARTDYGQMLPDFSSNIFSHRVNENLHYRKSAWQYIFHFFLPVPEILYLLALGWDLVSPGKGSTGMC